MGVSFSQLGMIRLGLLGAFFPSGFLFIDDSSGVFSMRAGPHLRWQLCFSARTRC
jgi:hypothetical protein